jgi:hypothetical protein
MRLLFQHNYCAYLNFAKQTHTSSQMCGRRAASLGLHACNL